MEAKADSPHVLLINPPIYDFALYDLYLKPFGLLRIGEWLRSAGYRVSHINALDYRDPGSEALLGPVRRKKDGTGKFFRQPLDYPPGLERIPRQFARYGILPEVLDSRLRALDTPPDLILITSGMTYWYTGVREAVERCRRIWPGVPVGVGGIYATLMPGHCRRICGPDFVTEGAVWPGMREELEKRGFPLPGGPPGPEYMSDAPVWQDSAVLRLNEGCPFSCEYCASNRISPSFEAGCPGKNAELVRRLYETRGTRHFAFYDDALLVNRRTVLEPFLRQIIDYGLPVNFYNPNALHIRYLDEPVLRLMQQAGFREIRMGFESSDDEFHREKDGKVTMDVFAAAVDALKASGFPLNRTAVYILAGLPGQRWEEVETSVRYAARFGLRCRIAQYSPVPGTALWEESRNRSSYPLEEEPVYHNSTFFSMEWEGFSRERLEYLKSLTRELYRPGSE